MQHLLLGEDANAPPLPGLTDKDVSVQAVCSVVGGTNFKCSTPKPMAGIGARWANVSAPLMDLLSHAGIKRGCGAWPAPGAGVRRIALVDDGAGGKRCSLRTIARKAAKAGFAALLLVEGSGARPSKPGDRKKHLPLPTALLKPAAGKQLRATLGGALKGHNATVALKALGRDTSGFWKTPTTLYQEGMKLLTAARKLRDDVEEVAAAAEGVQPLARRSSGDRAGGGAQALREARAGAAAGDAAPAVAVAEGATTAELRKLFDRATARLRLSARVEPRAHVARHELSNALYEYGLLFEREGGHEGGAESPAISEASAIVKELMRLDGGGAGGVSYRKYCDSDSQQQGAAAQAGGGRLRVVTVATDPRPMLTALQQSVENAGLELEVLGLGTTYPGLGLKIDIMAQWLPSVPDEDYVLLVDAYDVLFTQSAGELLERFRRFCAPVVFGAETRCHPDTALTLVHPPRHAHAGQPFHYLNSGTYMGRADHVKRMFRHLADDLRDHYSWGGADYRQVNDQRWFMRYWFLHHRDVVLDVHGELFHTLHQVDPAQFSMREPLGTLWSNTTNNRPCVLHGNGKDGKSTIALLAKRFQDAGWLKNNFKIK
eukprot:g7512.t1